MDAIKKLIAGDPETRTADPVAENIDRLKAIFPEAVVEGRIDFEVLRQLLGGSVDEREEKYGLNWHGKRRARQLALTPSTGTLRPCPEESVDWETTQNLMIEGDNLEVLKLLQKSYAGKVKLIYIDPPYNTGKDFVYPDDYRDNIKNYLELTGQVGDGGRKLTSNTEASGRFHTDWLNMMYPRLKVARNLLRDDGVILISIDDHEIQNLRIVMDEVWGEENFVAPLVWERSKKGDAKLIANVHEYIVCYARAQYAVTACGLWRRRKDGVDDVLAQYSTFRRELAMDHERIRDAMLSWYRNLPASDPRTTHKHYNWSDDKGLYFAADFAGPDDGRESRPRYDILHPVTGKPCKKPSTGWRWDCDKTAWALAQRPPCIHFGSDETTIPNRKSYLEEIATEPYPSVFYRDGRSATLEVEELVGRGVFQFPKNTDVLAELIELTTDRDGVVVDFFAGSASTGHAVMDLNAASGGHRRFVLVQLPEPIESDRHASIADVAKDRLRGAGRKVRNAHPLFPGDLGFRVFKLDSSNFQEWDANRENLAETLEGAVDHIKPGRTEQDILYELLLKQGLDLCVPIEQRSIAGLAVHSIGGGVLFACLVTAISREQVEALALGIVEWRKSLDPAGETTCVFRDSAFVDDVAKTNLAAILEQHGLSKVRSV